MSLIRAALLTFSLLTISVAHAIPLEDGEGLDKQSPEEILRARIKIQTDFADAVNPGILSISEQARILAKYQYLDPTDEVPQDLLNDAILYFDTNKDKFPNQGYITIVDFAPRSDKYRFYLVNMTDGSVEKYHTTHGTGSDPKNTGTATIFGNIINSGESSLGYIRTAEVYSGTYKTAVRLDGLSDTNSNIRDRAVVFHGWNGVHEANVKQGLTWGCITLDWKVKDAVLDKIKEGSLMYTGVSKMDPKLSRNSRSKKPARTALRYQIKVGSGLARKF